MKKEQNKKVSKSSFQKCYCFFVLLHFRCSVLHFLKKRRSEIKSKALRHSTDCAFSPVCVFDSRESLHFLPLLFSLLLVLTNTRTHGRTLKINKLINHFALTVLSLFSVINYLLQNPQCASSSSSS